MEEAEAPSEIRRMGDRSFRLTFVPTDELPERAATTAAIGLAFCGDNLVLLQHSIHEGLQPPGGHLERDETAQEALHREIREEVCAEVASDQMLGYLEIELLGDRTDYKYPVPSCMVFFAVRLHQPLPPFTPHAEASERVLVPPTEADSCQWVIENRELYERALTFAAG